MTGVLSTGVFSCVELPLKLTHCSIENVSISLLSLEVSF